MRLFTLVSAAGVLLTGYLVAGEAVPGCVSPYSPRYNPIPFPYPETDSEIIADFEHCYLVLNETNLSGRLLNEWRNFARRLTGLRGSSGPSAEESHLVRLIRAHNVGYEILRFEDWHERRRTRADGPHRGYLVRVLDGETEVARWMLAEDGGWRSGVHTQIRNEDAASEDRRVPGRLLSLAEAQDRLETHWGVVQNLRYAVFGSGPLGVLRSCVDLLRPCLTFKANGTGFLYSPEEERLFKIRSELGIFRIERKDEVSRLESHLALAKAMDTERDLVFAMGDEFQIARQIVDGVPQF